ncbi:hypothetical protein NQ317_004500 [Molorchus minor]|uniref:Uncharacterized protein n=1 Tax=Molorchus minor TaxID=1323400 RepID=A0ABQ9J7R8_9CUCU|nr:hypothetical protein NQ317_004500 [Molorchus minor]
MPTTSARLSLPVIGNSHSTTQRGSCVPPPQTPTCDTESETELWELQEPVLQPKPASVPAPEKGPLNLNGSSVGDLPAEYTVCSLEDNQFPVIGVYIDKRVIPGFKYRVRPLPPVGKPSTINKCLFNDRALTLQSIGRGYAKRFTFEADKNNLNNNENYFWGDNRPKVMHLNWRFFQKEISSRSSIPMERLRERWK